VDAFTLPMALFLSVAALGMWTFVAVAAWSDSRRREREAYYRSETLKKFAEMPAETGIAMIREYEKTSTRHRRERIKVGGMASLATGIGLMAFLHAIADTVYLVGSIPFFVGIALLAYSYLLAPKE